MLGHPGLKNKTLALVFQFAPITNVFSQMPEVITPANAQDLKPLKKLKAPVKIFSVAFSPDGTQLLAGGHNGGEVKQYRIWRWKTK